MRKLSKKGLGNEVAFNLAKTYTRQVAKIYAEKHANKVGRNLRRKCS